MVRELFDKDAEIIPQRKNLLKKKITSEHINIHVEEKERPPSPNTERTNSQWATGYNVNAKSIKLPEKMHRRKIFAILGHTKNSYLEHIIYTEEKCGKMQFIKT